MAELTRIQGNRFALEGEIGFANVPEILEQSLREFGEQESVEVELGAARALDSSAVALLVEWARHFELKGRKITFKHVPEQFQRIAQIAELDNVLGIC